jgi:hypothetical protein
MVVGSLYLCLESLSLITSMTQSCIYLLQFLLELLLITLPRLFLLDFCWRWSIILMFSLSYNFIILGFYTLRMGFLITLPITYKSFNNWTAFSRAIALALFFLKQADVVVCLKTLISLSLIVTADWTDIAEYIVLVALYFGRFAMQAFAYYLCVVSVFEKGNMVFWGNKMHICLSWSIDFITLNPRWLYQSTFYFLRIDSMSCDLYFPSVLWPNYFLQINLQYFCLLFLIFILCIFKVRKIAILVHFNKWKYFWSWFRQFRLLMSLSPIFMRMAITIIYQNPMLLMVGLTHCFYWCQESAGTVIKNSALLWKIMFRLSAYLCEWKDSSGINSEQGLYLRCH